MPTATLTTVTTLAGGGFLLRLQHPFSGHSQSIFDGGNLFRCAKLLAFEPFDHWLGSLGLITTPAAGHNIHRVISTALRLGD